MPRPTTLSYAMNKKTDKLLKASRDKESSLLILLPVGLITALLWSYFVSNLNRYLDGWIKSFTYDNIALSLTIPDKICFMLLLPASFVFGIVYVTWNKRDEKFKKYKKEVLDILEVDVCEHRSPCSCKDEYCKWIEEEEKVDLL